MKKLMHSKSDDIEIMRGIDTNNVVNRLIESFTQRYQEGLETRMRGSSYVFNRVKLLEYHFHKYP